MKITDKVYFYKGREEQKLARGAGSCNVVIVKNKPQIMIDSGLVVGGAFRDLEKAAALDGLNLRDTGAILHTHAHWDHISGDCIVQKKYGARVYAHPWEKPIVESREAAFQSMLFDTGEFYDEIVGVPSIVVRALLWYAGGVYRGLCVDETVEEGARLDFGLQVLCCHTPGHTPGHMGYYIPEGKAFVGGDLIDLETGTGADLNNPHSEYADGLASLEKVRAMDIDVFLPAHGKPLVGKDNVRALLDRMIQNTHGYIRDVMGFLSERDATLTEIFNCLMPGTPFTLKAMKMMQILTVLRHLEREGKVSVEKTARRHVWRLTRQ
ncbi:MAG: hypothetical protein Kow0099_33330 [Candidatus Abyssubacteria bacterium]